MVISSEPEIAFLSLGKIDHEVRSIGVTADSKKNHVADDQFRLSYVHSLYTLNTLQRHAEVHILCTCSKPRLYGTGTGVFRFHNEELSPCGIL